MSHSLSQNLTAGIILAAGTSSRLGRPKQLLLIDGKPLLAGVIQSALQSELDHTVVVLGYQAAEIQKALKSDLNHPKLEVVVNRNYHTGLAGSLKTGLKQVMADYTAVMILLADHPFQETFIINSILKRYKNSDKAICVPVHRGRRGHPVILGERFYADVMSLGGDIGAREIIKNHPEQLTLVELESTRSFMDIDSESDLARALVISKRNGEAGGLLS